MGKKQSCIFSSSGRHTQAWCVPFGDIVSATPSSNPRASFLSSFHLPRNYALLTEASPNGNIQNTKNCTKKKRTFDEMYSKQPKTNPKSHRMGVMNLCPLELLDQFLPEPKIHFTACINQTRVLSLTIVSLGCQPV